MHTLDWYEKAHGKVDGLILLQSTSLLRNFETINAAVRGGISKLQSLLAVSPASQHPAWCLYQESGSVVPLLRWGDLSRRAQAQKPAYALNGIIYISTPESLRDSKSFPTKDTKRSSIEDQFETIDIGMHFNRLMAEFFHQHMLANKGGQRP